MRLDVIGLLALSMALRYSAREFVCIWKHNFFARAGFNQAMMYCFCHGAWSRVLALYYMLSCRFLEGPHQRLRERTLEALRNRIDAIAMHGDNDEIVLLLRLFRYGQAEDLIDIFPAY